MSDTVIAPDLLPCPFCGGEAQIKMLGNDSILATRKLTARSKMRCGCEIGCSTFGCTVKVICCTLRPPLEKTRAWAIDKWNKRTSKAEQENVALKAENERLTKIIEDSRMDLKGFDEETLAWFAAGGQKGK